MEEGVWVSALGVDGRYGARIVMTLMNDGSRWEHNAAFSLYYSFGLVHLDQKIIHASGDAQFFTEQVPS